MSFTSGNVSCNNFLNPSFHLLCIGVLLILLHRNKWSPLLSIARPQRGHECFPGSLQRSHLSLRFKLMPKSSFLYLFFGHDRHMSSRPCASLGSSISGNIFLLTKSPSSSKARSRNLYVLQEATCLTLSRQVLIDELWRKKRYKLFLVVV